jgi:hypothetical protein
MHTGVSNTNISLGNVKLINGNDYSANDKLFARIESSEIQHFYSTRANSNALQDHTMEIINGSKVLSYLPLSKVSYNRDGYV